MSSQQDDPVSRRHRPDDDAAEDHWQCKVGLHQYSLATRSLRKSKWRCERCQKVKYKRPDAA